MNLGRIVAKALSNADDSLGLDEIVHALPYETGGWNKTALTYEVKSLLERDGSRFLHNNGRYALHEPVRTKLRRRIRDHLETHGFSLDRKGNLTPPIFSSKDELRRFHAPAVQAKYMENRSFLKENEEHLLEEFAEGDEVDVDAFEPRFSVVKPRTTSAKLFRYATLLWSVPVSNGFGRRVRFLVRDTNNGKLVGIFALGDPVFNLTCRDDWIGWDHVARGERLYNVMDIFILGAVPPYNSLLAGKLIALIAASNEVRDIIRERYRNKRTVIQGRFKNPSLALLTTSSALGKSSIYDRISYGGRRLYQPIGYSEGWGHFHLGPTLFGEMVDYLRWIRPDLVESHRFGKGPNWKIRTARECLKALGLPAGILRHGIKRQVFGIPLTEDFREFLQGASHEMQALDLPLSDLVEFFRERWLLPRAARRPEFRLHRREEVSKGIHSQGPTRRFPKGSP